MSDFQHAHSDAVERSVLAVLLDGRHVDTWSTLHEVCPLPGYFYTRNHALVYVICQDLANAGKPISAQSVRDRAAQFPFSDAMAILKGVSPDEIHESDYSDSVLANLGGFSAISELAAGQGNLSGFRANCLHLAEYYRQREFITLTDELNQAVTRVDGGPRGKELAHEAINRLAKIFGTLGGTTTLSAAVGASLKEHDRIQAGGDQRIGVWGLPSLDELVPLAAGKLITLSAAPGCGKTSLQLLASYKTAERLGKGSVGIISMEMDGQELANITIARETHISRASIESGILTGDQRQEVLAAQELIRSFDMQIKDEGDDCTIETLCGWIRQRHVLSGGKLHLVCLDYLQLLSPDHAKQSEYQMLTNATKRLKRLARELRICILNLSQMNRGGSKQIKGDHGEVLANPEPTKADLHGSGSLEKDSDAVVFIWSPKPTVGPTIQVKIKVAKNRGGREASVDAEFRKADGQRFVEITARQEPQHGTARRMETVPRDDEDLFA